MGALVVAAVPGVITPGTAMGGMSGRAAAAGSPGGVAQERVPQKAGIPAATFRVEDPKLRPAAGRTEPVPADDDLGALADDIAAEPDPRSAGQLEPERGGSGHGGDQVLTEPRRLQDDEQDTGPPGERAEPFEAAGQAGRTFRWMAVSAPPAWSRAGLGCG